MRVRGYRPQMEASTVIGTLRWNEFEGGFWSLEPDDGSGVLVLDGWSPSSGAAVADGSHVRARVHEREEQFGFLMAGSYVQVVELAPA